MDDKMMADKMLGMKRTVSRADLSELVKLAKENDAQFVRTTGFGGGGTGDPDDWCGTMWFKGPRPGKLIDGLVAGRWIIDVFPYGIINPEGVFINVRNQMRSGPF